MGDGTGHDYESSLGMYNLAEHVRVRMRIDNKSGKSELYSDIVGEL